MVQPNTFPPTRAFDKYLMMENVAASAAVLLTVWTLISSVRVCLLQIRMITKIKFAIVALSCAFLSFISIHWNVIGSAHRY